MPIIRIAHLQIDPAALAAYTAAVSAEIEASVRKEPGVLAIYAVAEKDEPTNFIFVEMYADEAAYQTHRTTDHFREYDTATKTMILSKRLIETVPIQLSAKHGS